MVQEVAQADGYVPGGVVAVDKLSGEASGSDHHPESANIFDPVCIQFSLQGTAIPLDETLRVVSTMRRALLAHWPQAAGQILPEWLSGHDGRGRPSTLPHIAIFPLQQPGKVRITGLGIALPAALSPVAREALLAFLDTQCATLRLYDNRGLSCIATLQRPAGAGPPLPETGIARQWASVTPVVLDRYPKGRTPRDHAAETIARACLRSGLPRPDAVIVHRQSLLEGVPKAVKFKPLPHKPGHGRRWHCHALLVFDRPVQGPLLMGAGRFQGYGLFQPLDQLGI